MHTQKELRPCSEDIQVDSPQTSPNRKIPHKKLVIPSMSYFLGNLKDMETYSKRGEIIIDGDEDLGVFAADTDRMNKILPVKRWMQPKQMKASWTNIAYEGRHFYKYTKLGYLKELILSFPDPKYIIYHQGLKVIEHWIEQNMTGLERLSLSFSNCDHLITDQGELFRDDFAKCLTNLKQFSLTLTNCEHISDKTLEIFASKFLHHLTSLQTLHLDFAECPEIRGQGLSKLGTKIKQRLVNLKDLKIVFARCPSKKNVILDGLEFKLPSKHQTMTLNFNYLKPKYDKAIGNLGSELIRYMRNDAGHLSFTFSSEPKKAENLVETLISGIADRLAHLRQLNLNFAACFETDETLKTLISKILSHPKELQILTINFNTFALNNKTIEIIGHELETHLNHLEILDLNFANCFLVSKQILKTFTKKIAANMKYLQKINLKFGYSFERFTYLLRKILVPIPTVNIEIF